MAAFEGQCSEDSGCVLLIHNLFQIILLFIHFFSSLIPLTFIVVYEQ